MQNHYTYCLDCECMMDFDSDVCARCGSENVAEVRGSAAAEDRVQVCSGCDNLVEIGVQYCDRCEEEAAQSHFFDDYDQYCD